MCSIKHEKQQTDEFEYNAKCQYIKIIMLTVRSKVDIL